MQVLQVEPLSDWEVVWNLIPGAQVSPLLLLVCNAITAGELSALSLCLPHLKDNILTPPAATALPRGQPTM